MHLFDGFEQYHILIEFFYRTDDHLGFFDIQLVEKIYITDISINARRFFLLQESDDSWILIDNHDMFMTLIQHIIDIASESSVAKQHYLIILFIDLLILFFPYSWQQCQERFKEMIQFFSIYHEIARSCNTDES